MRKQIEEAILDWIYQKASDEIKKEKNLEP